MAAFEKLDMNVSKSEARLTKSDYSQVVFNNVQDSYYVSGDIECEIRLPEYFNATSEDWVGIFPVGWNSTSDRICYQHISLPDDYQNGKAISCKLQFVGVDLPADDGDFYQFCYVTSSGLVRGTSMPCQFHHMNNYDFVTEEDIDDDMMVIRRRSNSFEGELKKAQEKIEIMKQEFDQLTEKYVEEKLNVESITKVCDQQKIQLEEKDKQIETLKIESKDMAVLFEALEEDNKNVAKERDELNRIIDENKISLRILQDRVTMQSNERDAMDGRLQQMDAEKQLLKEQLLAAEERLKLSSFEVGKLKLELEAVKESIQLLTEQQQETRNQLEAMSKSKAMVQEELGMLHEHLQQKDSELEAMHTHLSVTQRDLAKETEECRKLASTIEMIKEERSASIQKATISLQEKENELASKVKECSVLQTTISNMQAAYEAKTEGPSFALKQAYEQLKEKLRNESELRQKLCVELDRFKKQQIFLKEKEVELEKDVADLKNRLKMSEDVYVSTKTENLNLRKQIKRLSKQNANNSMQKEGEDCDAEEVREIEVLNTRKIAALHDHYRQELDKIREDHNRQVQELMKNLSNARSNEPSGEVPPCRLDPMAESASASALLQPPMTPLPPPLTPVRLTHSADKKVTEGLSGNTEEEKFEDAVGELQIVEERCTHCQVILRGNAEQRAAHVCEPLSGQCPVCRWQFDENCSQVTMDEHVNRHFDG